MAKKIDTQTPHPPSPPDPTPSPAPAVCPTCALPAPAEPQMRDVVARVIQKSNDGDHFRIINLSALLRETSELFALRQAGASLSSAVDENDLMTAARDRINDREVRLLTHVLTELCTYWVVAAHFAPLRREPAGMLAILALLLLPEVSGNSDTVTAASARDLEARFEDDDALQTIGEELLAHARLCYEERGPLGAQSRGRAH